MGRGRRAAHDDGLGRTPSPHPLTALGLEALLAQPGETLGIDASGDGDPAGRAATAQDRFAQQRSGHRAARRGKRIIAQPHREPQMIHLPAAGAAIEGLGDDQAERLLAASRVAARGHKDAGHQRTARDQAGDQPLRQGQKQGPLKQGLQGQEAGILQQRQVPALQGLDPPLKRGQGTRLPRAWFSGKIVRDRKSVV